jgi:hypothetical protein
MPVGYDHQRGTRCPRSPAGSLIALAGNLRHLVLLLDEWQDCGIAFVTLGGHRHQHRGRPPRAGCWA